MEQFRIQGGRKLSGSVRVGGAKNSTLPILAAVLLNPRTVVLHDFPRLADVEHMIMILTAVGCKVKREGGVLTVNASNVNSWQIPDAYVKEIRSSIVMLGAVLGRMKRAVITYPGGCEIGPRPINLHLQGLKALGVAIREDKGNLHCEAENLRGAEVYLEYPSVGATENIMLAAAKAKGRTVIRNAAKEPEITDLQNFINAMGGKILGAGSNTIIIDGVDEFHETEYTVISDRIVAGTYMIAAAVTGSDIMIDNIQWEPTLSIINKLREAGCTVTPSGQSVRVRGPKRLLAIEHTKTYPYPGFPTDMQAQLLAMLTTADGTSIITENIFENRYKHVPELIRMGARIKTEGRIAVVQGVPALHGAVVRAGDLRGGAALVLAALAASGETVIEHIHHIDRGYEDLESSLRSLNAQIERR